MATDLSDILSADAVEESLHAANKKALFQHLASQAARLTGIGAKPILSAITAREKVGPTGFGAGIAIPHGKVVGLDRVTCLFSRLAAPLPYEAIDRLPVDLVFLLLSPPDAGADHLKALARVSRVARDKQMVAKLRGARSRDAVYALLSAPEARDAA